MIRKFSLKIVPMVIFFVDLQKGLIKWFYTAKTKVYNTYIVHVANHDHDVRRSFHFSAISGLFYTFLSAFDGHIRFLSSPSMKLISYGDVTITGDGLQILTYVRHSWPLSSEGSLACHTYCDTGHTFIMVISEDPWHSHLFSSGAASACFND